MAWDWAVTIHLQWPVISWTSSSCSVLRKYLFKCTYIMSIITATRWQPDPFSFYFLCFHSSSIVFVWVPLWSFFSPSRPSLRLPAWWARSPISTCCWSMEWASMEWKVSQTDGGAVISTLGAFLYTFCFWSWYFFCLSIGVIFDQFGFRAIVKFHLIYNTLKQLTSTFTLTRVF